MKREAIVIKASVNESLPDHLFKSEIEKYRDVWFSVLARYKKIIPLNVSVFRYPET